MIKQLKFLMQTKLYNFFRNWNHKTHFVKLGSNMKNNFSKILNEIIC